MKICPKCHREYEGGKFCNECGGILIELQSINPSSGGFRLNLGDANAISGGVNMSDNHSVCNNSVSNVDSHNVITNNITQVERDKSPEEIKHEREQKFRELCIETISNGILTSEGKRKLEDLQYRLGIDENTASRIISEVSKRSERKSVKLSPPDQITFNRIKTDILANRLDIVKRSLIQLKAMVQRYSAEEIQYTYYMLQAILHPEECISEFEDHQVDKYWQYFWTSIAYKRKGNGKSQLLATDVSAKWDSISQENSFVLYSINALIDDDTEYAKEYLDNIRGEYSPLLHNLIVGLTALLMNDKLDAEELNQYQKQGLFYINNLFAGIKEQKNGRIHQQEGMQIQEETEAKVETEECTHIKAKHEKKAKAEVEKKKNKKKAKGIIVDRIPLFDTHNPLKYDFVSGPFAGLLMVSRNGKEGWIDKNGCEVIPCKYATTFCFSEEGMLPVCQNGKWGYIDKSGHEIVSYIYDEVQSFCEGLAPVCQNGKWGYIDKSGHVVISLKYDEVKIFCNGLAEVSLNGKWGIIDKCGHEVISCYYDAVIVFSNELIPVRLNGKWGYIDMSEHVVVPCKYDKVKGFSEGLAAICQNGKWGYIDKNEHMVVQYMYDEAEYFDEGLAKVSRNGKVGWIDKYGCEAIPCNYDIGYGFYKGVSHVCQNGKWGIIDKCGHKVISCNYDMIQDPSEELIPVRLNGKWGYIDMSEHVVVPCKYDQVKGFSEGLAAICQNGKWGYIDKNEHMVVQCMYDEAESFDEGVACATLDDNWYILVVKQETNPNTDDLAHDYIENSKIQVVEETNEAKKYFEEACYKTGQDKICLLQKAADAGSLDAMYELAHCFIDKNSSAKISNPKFVTELTKVADQGHIQAAMELGEYYWEASYGLEKDEALAEKYLLISANGNNYRAIADLSALYFALEKYDNAVVFAQKAAKKKQPLGMYILGYLYFFGKIGEPNHAEGFLLIKEAADAGQPNAQCTLADLYLEGTYVSSNCGTAKDYLEKAATQGHSDAMWILACLYNNQKHFVPNKVLSLLWLIKAADNGNKNAKVELEKSGRTLAFCDIDIETYKELEHKAILGDVDSQMKLAHLSLLVDDKFQEMYWYRYAAEQDNPEAQYQLGEYCYYENKYEEAKNYLKRAFENKEWLDDHIFANFDIPIMLGNMYSETDATEAFKWYRWGAEEADDDECQYQLALLYKNGKGVAASYDKYWEWLQAAVDQDHVLAKEEMESELAKPKAIVYKVWLTQIDNKSLMIHSNFCINNYNGMTCRIVFMTTTINSDSNYTVKTQDTFNIIPNNRSCEWKDYHYIVNEEKFKGSIEFGHEILAQTEISIFAPNNKCIASTKTTYYVAHEAHIFRSNELILLNKTNK